MIELTEEERESVLSAAHGWLLPSDQRQRLYALLARDADSREMVAVSEETLTQLMRTARFNRERYLDGVPGYHCSMDEEAAIAEAEAALKENQE